MSGNKIKFEDLPDEVIEKLDLKGEATHGDLPVAERLVVMGKVLRPLAGLTNRDALWVLDRVMKMIRGQKDRRGGNHGTPGRPTKESIDE